MRKTVVALFASALLAPAALAAPAGDPLAPIHQLLDGLNKGDMRSANAAYAPGDISITDEFAPHHWAGPTAPQAWAAGYDQFSKTMGVTDGLLKYGAPIRTEVDATSGYVVVPVLYSYKEHGKPVAEDGQMTFVLTKAAGAWKIKDWTWAAPPAHPAR